MPLLELCNAVILQPCYALPFVKAPRSHVFQVEGNVELSRWSAKLCASSNAVTVEIFLVDYFGSRLRG